MHRHRVSPRPQIVAPRMISESRLAGARVLCLALLFIACGSGNERTVAAFIEAHNDRDRDRALSLVSEDGAFRAVEELRLAVNTHYVHGPLEVTGDTVTCELSLSSDLFSLLGVDTMRYTSWRFILEEGLIRDVEEELADESLDHFTDAMQWVEAWIEKKHPELESTLTPQEGGPPFTLDNYKTWLSTLEEWAQFEAPNLAELVPYHRDGLDYDRHLFNPIAHIATRTLSRGRYSRLVSEALTVGPSWDDVIHVANLEGHLEPDYSERRWLCLDKRGSVIRSQGKPVLVEPFTAEQRATSQLEYDGAVLKTKFTTIYPCTNCAAETGVEACHFVW